MTALREKPQAISILMFVAWVSFLILAFHSHTFAADRPNILWISCEDISPHLGCYGHPQATTPNLDTLATQGVRYENAFTVTGVCATCRASIITSMFPSSLGNQFMRGSVDLPDHVRLFPSYLREAGYYCTNNSKTDYNITGNHSRCWDESSNKAHYRNRKSDDQPFFAVFNIKNTHESRIFNYRRPENLKNDEFHDPALMELPPYYPDTDITRRDWAHYFDNITSMDKIAGDILRELEEAGLADDTIVVFWSDHGVGLPRAKRWIYESGTHVPLIVRIPQKFRPSGQAEPGTISDELVSLMDLGPTMLNLAGIELPDAIHGRAFLGNSRSEPRQLIYTIRDRMDERYDMMRAVRNHRYKYIRNYQSFKPYFQITNTMEREHTMKELRRLHALNMLQPAAAQFMVDSKPLEEFYDLKNDPHEINNLIDQANQDDELRQNLDSLRRAHIDWVFETRDTGLIPEAELARRGKLMGTRFAILNDDPDHGRELLERLLATNRMACSPKTVAPLVEAYQDPDPAVRFWAITGLGNLRTPSPEALATVRQGLADPVATVRVAAARAAWQLGKPQLSLEALRLAARSDEEFLSLSAMHVIDEMEDQRDDFMEVIRWVDQNGKGYPVRIAKYLLSQNTP